MKALLLAVTGITLSISTASFAEGDAAVGKKEFKKCKACHAIKNGDEVIIKGGKTGPNLYGVIGRAAGAEEFKYSQSLLDAGVSGLVWDEASIVAFITDPSGYLKEFTGDSGAKSKMTFKAKKKAADLAAYLTSVSPEAAETGETTTENSDS